MMMKIKPTITHKSFYQLFNPKWRYLCYYGGRGAGRSHSIAKCLVLRSMKEDLRILNTRETASTIDHSLKENFRLRIKEMGLNNYFDIKDKDITNKITGSKFIYTGLRAQDIEGKKSFEGIDILWIEEARKLTQKTLDIIIPTIRKPGSQIIISFNPEQEFDPIYKMFITDKIRKRTFIKKLCWYDNPYFPTTPAYEDMLYDKNNNPDKYDWIWEGNCLKISDSVVFKNRFKKELFETPKDATFYLGLDFGFANDPNAFLRCFIDKEKRLLFIDKAGQKVGVKVEDTEQWLLSIIPDAKKWHITVDSARPEMIDYLRDKNFYIESAKKGPDSVKEGIEFLKNYTIIIHESLTDVYHDFSLFSYKTDKLTGNIIPEIENKNKNYPDALRYATEDYRTYGNRKYRLAY